MKELSGVTIALRIRVIFQNLWLLNNGTIGFSIAIHKNQWYNQRTVIRPFLLEKFMSYESALRAAGAKVLEFEYFGSYQGDWYALVEYNHEIGWICGSYGSCSGCDAFEGEFGYVGTETVGEMYWDRESGDMVAATEKSVAVVKEHLAAFGKTYLDCLMTQRETEQVTRNNHDWDEGARDAHEFVKAHSIKNRVN